MSEIKIISLPVNFATTHRSEGLSTNSESVTIDLRYSSRIISLAQSRLKWVLIFLNNLVYSWRSQSFLQEYI